MSVDDHGHDPKALELDPKSPLASGSRGVSKALIRLVVEFQASGLQRCCWVQAAPESARQYILFTGGRSERNIRFYRRAGYDLQSTTTPPGHIAGAVFMIKPVPERPTPGLQDILQI
ncbi:hypothetical protein [Microlunatus parietis]|uniref:N-acetyltransferase domain-containing protein n=1 Tax=Microlunatus parietis TaxID=682979 RepID=A0A7Y9I6N0_9ACTN|nr:hypothetical protein [Microlunatus parietis]NYE71259.1 hypothetical protein [Microlunatus parietis]